MVLWSTSVLVGAVSFCAVSFCAVSFCAGSFCAGSSWAVSFGPLDRPARDDHQDGGAGGAGRPQPPQHVRLTTPITISSWMKVATLASSAPASGARTRWHGLSGPWMQWSPTPRRTHRQVR